MVERQSTSDIHDLAVTVWIGKGGIEPTIDELDRQLQHTPRVKVRVLRTGRGEASVSEMADHMAEAVDGTVLDVRGYTAVIER